MFLKEINSCYIKLAIKRINQGDILRNIDVIDWSYADDDIEIGKLTLPYAIVISQDCDLDKDFENRSKSDSDKHDKYLRTILICPAYIAADFKVGDHLKELELKMETWNSKRFSLIKNQNNTRFHYLEQNQDLQVPELIVDFKHYYTIPTDTLIKIYNKHYLVTINPLFRECLSQRFSYYLSRIGLPEIKKMTSSECAEPTN